MVLSDLHVKYFRTVCIVVLLAGAACYVVFTAHWQWMWDTQVMHYVVLLMRHGRIPYRTIYDINMPGAYLTERWALAIFGGGDLGWRIYEYALLGSLTLSMMVVAKGVDWAAGLFAGVLVALQLGSLGPWQAAERDEVMTVLLAIGYAFLFTALRKHRAAMMLPFGLAFGIAMLIKPTVLPLTLCLLLFSLVVLRKKGRRLLPHLGYAIVGLAIAGAILLQFLVSMHATKAFIYTLTQVIPAYSAAGGPSWAVLIRRSMTQAFLVYIPLALLLAFNRERTANWEMWAVRAGFIFGLFSYFLQRKGYDYHRVPLLSFGLLWIGMEFFAALKERDWRRYVAVAGLAFGVLLIAPMNVRKTRANKETNAAVPVLQHDLKDLGGESLQEKVECLDMVGGCYSALFRMGLAGSTGFTGDAGLFALTDNAVVQSYRNLFLKDVAEAPPKVIILGNDFFEKSTYSFEKLNTWPAFNQFLAAHYRLYGNRGPFTLYGYPMAYRIYVLK